VIRGDGQSPAFPGWVRSGPLVATSGLISPGVLQQRVEDFAQQAACALEVLRDTLERAGSGLDRVLRIEAFLADIGHVTAWNDAFAATWPQHRPARSTLVVGFVLPGVLLELQALASCGVEACGSAQL
jgi:2-iminobutanoate/2-iminopropanoate deaminase